MKKAVVEAWLSGLRSGKYKQVNGSVNNGVYNYLGLNDTYIMRKAPDAFCCIGVGAVCNGMNVEDMRITNHASAFIGLKDCSAWETELIGMNDQENKSFAEIADWIEANILPNATEE